MIGSAQKLLMARAGVSAGGGGWNPLQLSIIDAWYDVSDASTVTETSSSVTALSDKTSSNYDLSLIGTSPVYSSTGWDGSLPAIEFSGNVVSALRSSNRLTQSDITIAAVYDADNTTAIKRPFGIHGFQASTSAKETFALAPDNTLRFDGAFASGSISSTAGKFLRVANVNATTMYDYINGSQNISSAVTSGLSTDGYISIGEVVSINDSTDTYVFDGRIAEAVVCIGTLSQSEREKLEGYFAHKWGLTGSLPALHPYKSSPPASQETA